MTARNAQTMGAYGSQWQFAGYCGQGNVEGLFDSLRGLTAVVCGGAKGVFEEAAEIVSRETVVFAANDVGVYLPKVDHMVSLHATKIGHWAALRKDGSSKSNWQGGTRTHTISETPGIDYHWSGLTPVFALSGYFAMQIAYLMGAERIILCGCPGDLTPRFFEAGPRTDNFDYQTDGVIQQLTHEMGRLPEFKNKVRSMSGWTRKFFGGV